MIKLRMDSFVIMPCDEYNVLSFHVPDDFMLNSHRMMRVISKSFVTGLLAMNDLEIGYTYKISGTYSEKNNDVIFNMSDIRRYRLQELFYSFSDKNVLFHNLFSFPQ